MKFRAVQENLRRILQARIDTGMLTGMRLAQQTGFKQAHISNFLNRKRGLSTEGMDKVLQVQRLSVFDLLDPEEFKQRASALPPGNDQFENIPVVDSPAATQPAILSRNVKDIAKFKKSFLRKLRPEMGSPRKNWRRFIAIQVDGREGMSMYPRLQPGAIILLDRHYNSLKPYGRAEHNLYAVNKNGECTVKYVEVAGRDLILRPHNPAYPVELIAMDRSKKPADYLLGRICHVAIDF
jgi:SOS-response transcriptional repressor LexA